MPQYAVELDRNPVPVMVIVNAVIPALVNDGDRLFTTGMGFDGLLTSKVTVAVAML